MQDLETTRVNEFGVLRASWDILNVRVSKGNLRRALLIMNTLMWYFESQGWTVRFDKMWKKTTICIKGEDIGFKLWEKVIRADRKPPAWRPETFASTRWIFTPTGEFQLIIDHYVSIPRKCWSDAKNHRVEDFLGDFIAGLKTASLAAAEMSQMRAMTEQAEKVRLEKAEQEHQKRVVDHNRKQQLEEAAALHQKAEQIRMLVRAILPSLQKMDNLKVKRWSSWAEKHANDLDPLQNGWLDNHIESVLWER